MKLFLISLLVVFNICFLFAIGLLAYYREQILLYFKNKAQYKSIHEKYNKILSAGIKKGS